MRTPHQLDLGFLQEKNKQRVCTHHIYHESITYIHTFSACERSSSRSWLSSSPTDSLICDQTRNKRNGGFIGGFVCNMHICIGFGV